MKAYRFKRTTLQLVLFVALLFGIGLSILGLKISFLYVALATVTIIMLRKRNLLVLILIIFVGLGLGSWHGQNYLNTVSVYDSLYGQRITFTAQAAEDSYYNKYKQMTFATGDILLNGNSKLPGKVLISGFGVNSILQGDEVLVTGKIMQGYGTYSGKLSYAQIEVVAQHPSMVADVRRKFVNGMQNALPEPLASFAMGLLVGQRATLPEEIKQDLLMVGLTHIIAVSGYNLTIILRASGGLFAKQSKRLTTYFSLMLIAAFLLITGSSASIVRAAIVSMLSIWAGYYGRSFRPLNLIALAAVITAWANPLYIWFDIGWYLSFLAFYGVLVLAPMLAKRLKKRWRTSILVMVALESICAEIMTLPYILYQFGQISLIGLPANVLVVALIPLAMLLSFVAGLAGMIVSPIAGWLAIPAKILLTYMLDVAHILSHVRNVFIENLSLTLNQMLGLYVMVGLLTSVIWFKNRAKTATITDKSD